MPITDVRMQNFRSFSDETTLQFKRGLNVLVSTLLPTPLARVAERMMGAHRLAPTAWASPTCSTPCSLR